MHNNRLLNFIPIAKADRIQSATGMTFRMMNSRR